MSGTGGNRVEVYPEADLVVVIANENYGLREAHGNSDRLLADFLLPEIQAGAAPGAGLIPDSRYFATRV